MTPDLHRVRRKLAVLREMVEGDMPVKTRWLALRLIDSSLTAIGPEPEPMPPTQDQIEAGRLGNLIPFPRGPSSMTRDLLLEET